MSVLAPILPAVLRGLVRLVCAGLVLLLSACDGEWQEVETGYRGEARRNPYLAAEMLLRDSGRPADSSTSLTELRQLQPAFLVAPVTALNDRATVDLLREQVQRGLHLCLLLEDGEIWQHDWGGGLDTVGPETHDDGPLADWLAELGLEIGTHDEDWGQIKVVLDNTRFKLAQPSSLRLSVKGSGVGGDDQNQGDVDRKNHGEALVTRRWHTGQVTVLASAEPFRNPHLAELDHAALLLALDRLGPSRAGPALFLIRADVSLWQLLWQHGWPALLGAALATVLLLWWHMPRRQPIRVRLEAGDRASFRDQIVGTGSFLWQRGDPETLLGGMRRLALKRWRRRQPLRQVNEEFAGGFTLADIEAIASWLGEPPAVVQAALADPVPTHSREFEPLLRRLQQILVALR